MMLDDKALDFLHVEAKQDLMKLMQGRLRIDNPLIQMMDMDVDERIGYLSVFNEREWMRLNEITKCFTYLSNPTPSKILTFLNKVGCTTKTELIMKTGYSKNHVSKTVNELLEYGYLQIKGEVKPMETGGGAPATIYGVKGSYEDEAAQAQHRYYILTLGRDPVEEERLRIEEEERLERERVEAEQERIRLKEEEQARRQAEWEAGAPERERQRKLDQEKKEAEEQAKRAEEAEKERKRLEANRKREAEKKEKQRLRETVSKIYVETTESLKEISENPDYEENVRAEAAKWDEEHRKKAEWDEKLDNLFRPRGTKK